jgi:FrmR/RcnR family transcriptional regulator, repressor of frmRAB operon
MQYTDAERRKLVHRLNRIRGQLEAMQGALAEDAECTALIQQATACRGALDGFIAAVVEHHIRQHIVDPRRGEGERSRAAEELIRIVRVYIT